MKKLLFILAFTAISPHWLRAQCSDINYDAYTLVYYDEFNYLCEAGAPYAFQADPAFNARWSLTSGDWGAGNEYYYPANATMNTCGIITLTEHDLGTPFYTSSGRYITKSSGTLISKSGFNAADLFGNSYSWQTGYGYGVLEASMKFTHEGSIACGNSGVAFWTGGKSQTEIDIIDDAHNNWAPHRVGDWEYSPAHALSLGGSIATDLSVGFHTFSCVWEPNYVSFYIDGCFRGTVGYDQVRTFQDFTTLKFAMLSCTGIPDGISVDIDWVKTWRRKCDPAPLELSSTVSLGSYVYPGFYKRAVITNSSPTLIKTKPNRVTLLEAEATIINPNFLADESVLNHATPTLDAGPSYQIANGYFEILPIRCGVETSGWFRSASGGEGGSAPGDAAGAGLAVFNVTSAMKDGDWLKLSPNPAKDEVRLSFLCAAEGRLQVCVKDVSGRTVRTYEWWCNEHADVEEVLDIADFSPGMYFVDVALNQQHVVKKVIKQ